MKNKSQIGVLLKGGLGNQLFQVASGMYHSNGDSLEVFNNYTQPRQTNGLADALYFELPSNIHINNSRSNRLERKLLALNLRLAFVNVSYTRLFKVSKLVNVLINIIISFKLKKRSNVHSGDGAGFCEVSLKPGVNLLNGYYQAHQFPYHPAVHNRLREISLKDVSPSLGEWIEAARREKPIIVHVRLGDYKNERGIGLLHPIYYEKALRLLELSESTKYIWIFSDEPESVLDFVSPPSAFQVRVIGKIGLNPAETLELMRYGSAYVIANSTFSWWAAFLSYQKGCTTIMPRPWFQEMPSPIGIKPHDWTEIEFLK